MGKSSLPPFTGGPILKGTSLGASTNPITFAQMQQAYNKVVKQQPNPYPTRSNVDAVVQREIFPRCIGDTLGAQENFHDWAISEFTSGPRGYAATVTAVRNSDQLRLSKMIWIDPTVLLGATGLDQMFTHLDVAIDDAVDWIAHYQDPHDTATCTDPECYC